jgi:hypothetical protein
MPNSNYGRSNINRDSSSSIAEERSNGIGAKRYRGRCTISRVKSFAFLRTGSRYWGAPTSLAVMHERKALKTRILYFDNMTDYCRICLLQLWNIAAAHGNFVSSTTAISCNSIMTKFGMKDCYITSRSVYSSSRSASTASRFISIVPSLTANIYGKVMA